MSDEIPWRILSAELPEEVRVLMQNQAQALGISIDVLAESYCRIYAIGLYNGAMWAAGKTKDVE
jgi:hypothetical protein